MHASTPPHPAAAKYAAALDGLQLDNPVEAFFDFCKERENVRKLRASGSPGPWSEDPIFQRGRFLNVFREDDRVTKSIMSFVGAVSEEDDLLALVQAAAAVAEMWQAARRSPRSRSFSSLFFISHKVSGFR